MELTHRLYSLNQDLWLTKQNDMRLNRLAGKTGQTKTKNTTMVNSKKGPVGIPMVKTKNDHDSFDHCCAGSA